MIFNNVLVVKMFTEGIKETENTRIEKDPENFDEIEMLYSFGVVIFEHTILESEDYEYSFCWFEPEKIFDIIIKNRKLQTIEVFKSCPELDEEYEKLFQLIKDEEIKSNDKKIIKCVSHSIEYTL